MRTRKCEGEGINSFDILIDRNEGELMGLANESRCRADEATAQQILGNLFNKGDYSLISPLLSGIKWGTSKNNDNPEYRKESPKDDINKENVTNFLQSLKNDMRAISNLNEVGFRRLANRLGSSNLNQAEKCIVMFAIGRALASWILDEKSDKTSMEGRRCRGRRCFDDDDEEMNEAKKGGRIGLQHNIKFI